jgi:ferredoxin
LPQIMTLSMSRRIPGKPVSHFTKIVYNGVVKITMEVEKTMAYVIQDACIACGACEPECPVEAISPGDIYVIDADKCIDCGACNAVCPVDAPQPE